MVSKVIKRDGSLVDYDVSKIKSAIRRAGNVPDLDILVGQIDNHIKNIESEKISVDEIQKVVEDYLMITNQGIARNYITYRYLHDVTREKYDKLMAMVEKRLLAKDVQNQNANVDERSFGGRIGEMSDAVSKQYALDYLMSPMSRHNHENNEIYIHDLSAYAVGMHNCFSGDTKFVTSEGVRTLKSIRPGEGIEVIDKDGKWRQATVENFGKQTVWDLTFQAGKIKKKVTCTRNHRWVLADGTITEDIQVGDKLALLPETDCKYERNDFLWGLGYIVGTGKEHLGDCEEEFKKLGINIDKNYKYPKDISRTQFLDSKAWLILYYSGICSLMEGFMYVIGSMNITIDDSRAREFIEYCAPVAGYHILNKDYHKYTLLKSQKDFWEYNWELISITNHRIKDVYCVVEPQTHTFTLDGAMVTGNCLTLPLDKLLANGFKTRQTDVRPAQSVNTAMQLVAVLMQLQSLGMFGISNCFAELKQC